MSRRKRRNGKNKVASSKAKIQSLKLTATKKIQQKKKTFLKSDLKKTRNGKNVKQIKKIFETQNKSTNDNQPVPSEILISKPEPSDILPVIDQGLLSIDNILEPINIPKDTAEKNNDSSAEKIEKNEMDTIENIAEEELTPEKSKEQQDAIIHASELRNQIDENSSEPEFEIDLSREDEEEMEGDYNSSAQNFCTFCNLNFGSRTALTNHMKEHSISNNQIHQCLICNRNLSSSSSLDRHMLTHSGERPFKCKLCDMSFTTNGNMHRHMRTHGEMDINEAEKSLDLRRKDVIKNDTPEEGESALNESDKKIHCPVCGKTFLCKYGLQSHMETHPNDPILCQKCDKISVNYNAHIDHKCEVSETKPSYKCCNMSCGFQDLTFMDFTSNKFSLVSKSYCEKNVKRPSSAFHKFECSKCNKAFPCGRALKLHERVHETEIGTFCHSCHCDFASTPYLQMHQLKHRSVEHCLTPSFEKEINDIKSSHNNTTHAGKEDFLALLNLQTKQSHLTLLRNLRSCHVKEDNFENYDYFVHGKIMQKDVEKAEGESCNIANNNNNNDFADIQSIITLTSKAPLIQPAQTSPIAVRPTSPTFFTSSRHPVSPPIAESANASPETPSKDEVASAMENHHLVPHVNQTFIVHHGSYSCKICSQRFKNISALKRHSKLHVQRGSNYSCHICSYVSVDKSTLIRHLRTHNGERPFQCVICKYAFTTKANCERHVRKRHKKYGKAEIRNSMQYNPNMSLRTPDSTSGDISNSETVCKYCGSDFKFNRVLRHHLRSLQNSCNRKPFSCKICKFGFSTKNNCIRHVLKQHPNLKDKLRSVVIPNPQMPQATNSELMSGTDNSNSSTGNQPVNEEMQPLDLHCDEEEDKPLNLQTDKVTSEFNVNETVIAAQGLVSLSEAPPLQEEPLDLAAHALDLSCKPLSAVTKKLDSKPSSIFNNTTSCHLPPVGSMNLSPPKTPSPPLPVTENNIQISPLPMNNCSKKIEVLNNKNEVSPTSAQKHRSFTCIYCNAGFTLKSNMERHIKRKHPEFARPTRSRNFIPSIVTPNLQKQNLTTLSDETRNALRHHVLSTKVQQMPVYKNFKPETSFPNVLIGTTGLIAPVNQVSNSTTVLNLSLDLSAKTEQIALVNLGTPNILKPAESNADEACSDLASVSSVICTANSPQFTQYLGKPTESEKMDTTETVEKKDHHEEVNNTKKSELPSVSCPFCDRQFPWTSSLRRHILTHTGQKPFKCPKCSLWFTTKSNCERHLIRKHGHKGDLITRSVPDRPFKCNHCLTSTFSTQGNLRKHFYLKHWTKSYLGMNNKPPVHSEKKSDVDSSSAVFDSSTNLATKKSDVLISSGVTTQEHSYSQPKRKSTFSCHFCDNSFENINDLSAHMLKHNGVIYVCYLCRKTFPNHEICFNHFKTSHSLVYMQINQKDISQSFIDNNTEENEVPMPDNGGISSVACMVCFQKMSSVGHLQQHFKSHLLKDKQNDGQELTSLKDNADLTESTLKCADKSHNSNSVKKTRVSKSKVNNNSLLYFFSKASSNGSPIRSPKNVNSKMEIPSEENSDLIQNLLGIPDSKTIDEMLVSPDSAARILGVKEM